MGQKLRRLENYGKAVYMRDDEFEWDDVKAASNLRKHKVSFKEATAAFRDPFALEWIDDAAPYGEERSVLLGMSNGLLYVVFTERGPRRRIISARPAERHETDAYYRQNGP